MIVMPAMARAQSAAWLGVMDLHDRLDHGWTLIGGQLVHLHCAERGQTSPRPTDDIDTVVDVRADAEMLRLVTEALVDLGFAASGISADGVQHRWVRGDAVIDVLLPEGIGERAGGRGGVTGSPSISAPGGTQALHRSESVAVTVEDREGFVRRPNLVGALVMKASAHTAVGDAAKGRHRVDFLTLAELVGARDFRDEDLTGKDRKRLREMIAATRADDRLMVERADAEATLTRLERGAGVR